MQFIPIIKAVRRKSLDLYRRPKAEGVEIMRAVLVISHTDNCLFAVEKREQTVKPADVYMEPPVCADRLTPEA